MKEYLTVAEAAKELNISKQAVYQRLEKDLKPYVKTLNGQKVISSKAIKSLAADKPEELQDETTKLKQETIEALKDTIEILKQQLDIKDKQIELLNDRLQEASQRLSEVNSIAFKQIPLPAPADAEEATTIIDDEQPKHRGILQRLFNSK